MRDGESGELKGEIALSTDSLRDPAAGILAYKATKADLIGQPLVLTFPATQGSCPAEDALRLQYLKF